MLVFTTHFQLCSRCMCGLLLGGGLFGHASLSEQLARKKFTPEDKAAVQSLFSAIRQRMNGTAEPPLVDSSGDPTDE